MKELHSPYMDRGTSKNSEAVPLGEVGSQNTSLGRGRREKRHETCQNMSKYLCLENMIRCVLYYEEGETTLSRVDAGTLRVENDPR